MPSRLRLALLLAAIGYCAAAAGSGLDRAAEKKTQLASHIPALFADKALAVRSAAALDAHDILAAKSLAELAVSRSPIDPASTALLGAARLESGDNKGALTAFRVAGLFGWRSPLTQVYWMQVSLSTGNYRLATQRLDALLRQYPALLNNRQLMDPIERNPQARLAMVERLTARPIWLANYARDVEGADADIMAIRGDVLLRVAAHGQRLGCEGIAPSVRRLVLFNAVAEAAQLWRAHCPTAAHSMLADGNFAALQFDPPLTPFGWTMPGDGELDVTLTPGKDGKGQTVGITSSAAHRRSFVTQLLVVPPGSYQLRWEAPSNRIAASIGCMPDSQIWISGSPDSQTSDSSRGKQNSIWLAPIVIDTACQGHWLTLSIAPGSGPVGLGNLSLVPR
jgi:hypothetical protein